MALLTEEGRFSEFTTDDVGFAVGKLRGALEELAEGVPLKTDPVPGPAPRLTPAVNPAPAPSPGWLMNFFVFVLP